MTTVLAKMNVRPKSAQYLTESDNSMAGEPRSLARAVQAGTQAINEKTLRPVAGHSAGVVFQPRTLLALLTYCYAREIYGSAQVEAWLRRDAHFCQFCHDGFPDARTLRRFRRENRD